MSLKSKVLVLSLAIIVVNWIPAEAELLRFLVEGTSLSMLIMRRHVYDSSAFEKVRQEVHLQPRK